MRPLTLLLTTLSTLSLTAAHSHITYLIIDSLLYPGFTPRQDYPNGPDTAAWSTTVYDDGFVPPSLFSTPAAICAANATSPAAYVPATPGTRIHVQWNGWPASHHGPILTYLASCPSTGCHTAEPSELEFFKIAGEGLWETAAEMEAAAVAAGQETGGLDGAGWWAADDIIGRNNSYVVEIPPRLKEGLYVLRHELIALHFAAEEDGAQIYPQCFNLMVTNSPASEEEIRLISSSTATDEEAGAAAVEENEEAPTDYANLGIPAQSLYDPSSDSFNIDIYQGPEEYVVPGPPVVPGAGHVVDQEQSFARERGTPYSVDAERTVAVRMTITTEDMLTMTPTPTETVVVTVEPRAAAVETGVVHWA